MKPVIESCGQALLLRWPDYNFSIGLDRFRESRGTLFAELDAKVQNNGGPPQTVTTLQVNLKSPRTRDDLVRRLTRLSHGIDQNVLEQMVEQTCVLGVRHYRCGEPVEELAADMVVPTETFRLSPLVFDAHPSIVFADGGTGKSFLALTGAHVVEAGSQLGPLRGVQGRTLFLDWESDRSDFIGRMKRLQRGHPEWRGVRLLYRRQLLPMHDDLPTIARIVAEHQIRLLLVDSLAPACGSELGAPETAMAFFRAIRSLGIGSLIIAHVPKNAEQTSVFGSVFFRNLARSCWELQTEHGDHELKVALFHKKANFSGLHAPLGFRYRFQPEAILVEPLELASEPVLQGGLSALERVKQALGQHGQATSEELAQLTGLPLDRIKVAMSKECGRAIERAGKEGRAFMWKLRED